MYFFTFAIPKQPVLSLARSLASRAGGPPRTARGRKPPVLECDCVVIGGGVAGACAAYELSKTLGNKLVILEKATKGDASYDRIPAPDDDGDGIQVLADASLGFLAVPELRDVKTFLSQRSTLHLAKSGTSAPPRAVREVLAEEAVDMLPALQRDAFSRAWLEDTHEVDAVALRSRCLAAAKVRGVPLRLGTELLAASWDERLSVWKIKTSGGGELVSRRIVNAAGPYADEVASRCNVPRLGLTTHTRTCSLFTTGKYPDATSWDWPRVNVLDDKFSFGPVEYGVLGVSCDSCANMQPEWYLERWSNLAAETQETNKIKRCRTFDGEPIIGADTHYPSFFWACGYGSIAAPAAARIVAMSVSASRIFSQIGLPASATPEQIKKAYLRLAFECHPDQNPGDPTASARFQELQEKIQAIEAKRQHVDFPSDLIQRGVNPSTFAPSRLEHKLEITSGTI